MQSSFEIWGQNPDVGYQILCCSIWHDANCLHSSAYSHLINADFPQSTIFKKNAAVKSRTAQKLVAGAEASRCMQSWQYAGKEEADNIQEEAFRGLRIVQEHRELFRSHFWYQEELLWEGLQQLATTCTVTRAAPSKRQIAINNCLPASYYFSLVCKIYATVEANEFCFFFLMQYFVWCILEQIFNGYEKQRRFTSIPPYGWPTYPKCFPPPLLHITRILLGWDTKSSCFLLWSFISFLFL